MEKDMMFLLSDKEVRSYLSDKGSLCQFKGTPCCWWLRMPGYDVDYTAYVLGDGDLYLTGIYVNCSTHAVRPALHLNPDSLNSLKRNKEGYVMFGNREWLILDEETGLLLSKDAVCERRFDAESNNYEESEIRDYLNGELLNELFTREEQEMIMDTIIDGENSYPAV